MKETQIRNKLYEIQDNILKIIIKHLKIAKKDFIFVGGTAINRLIFNQAYRFSKDLDLFIEESEDLNYVDELYSSLENYKNLVKDLLEKTNTSLIAKGQPARINYLENPTIRKYIDDDFFIEYNVEADFRDEIISIRDPKLNLNIKTLSPLNFLNNKLIKVRDKLKFDESHELIKDLIDIYMLYQTFNDKDENTIKLKEEICEYENTLKNIWNSGFENESKKYLFDLEIVPKTFNEFYQLFKRI